MVGNSNVLHPISTIKQPGTCGFNNGAVCVGVRSTVKCVGPSCNHSQHHSPKQQAFSAMSVAANPVSDKCFEGVEQKHSPKCVVFLIWLYSHFVLTFCNLPENSYLQVCKLNTESSPWEAQQLFLNMIEASPYNPQALDIHVFRKN